jgi:PAP2 superfamily C-terminal
MPEIRQSCRAWIASRAVVPAVMREDGGRLPSRLPFPAWALALVSFFAAYFWIFSFVHVRADTTACFLRLDDPLYHLVSLDLTWKIVTVWTYMVLTGICVALMLAQASLGDHRPLVRFGMGLAIMGLIRGLCITLVPLCRTNSLPGSITLPLTPMLDLGFTSIPWRVWAKNDMLFSGHVGEFFLLWRVTRSWPRPARAFLAAFSALQIFGLLATRGHYTIDIILAFPCAYFADRMAVLILSRLSVHREPVEIRGEDRKRGGMAEQGGHDAAPPGEGHSRDGHVVAGEVAPLGPAADDLGGVVLAKQQPVAVEEEALAPRVGGEAVGKIDGHAIEAAPASHPDEAAVGEHERQG